MKIALFGNGKTGGKVREAASQKKHQLLGPDTRTGLPTIAELRLADVAVVFVPGSSLAKLLPLLLEAGIPVVSGSTGYKFSEQEKSTIAARGIPWVQASNFSLGMNLAFELARRIGAFRPAKAAAESLTISEVHHTKKLDSPSGTALSLKSALGIEVPVHSFREGDVIGEHSLELRLPGEILTLAHEVSDRLVFAEGAVWAAELLREKKLKPGFHLFEDLVRTYCFEGAAQ
jgi:4-hydroxy-tetrahydrodipicolinate reductase